MTRALVHVEGETEEAFVNEILSVHLTGYGEGPSRVSPLQLLVDTHGTAHGGSMTAYGSAVGGSVAPGPDSSW